MEQGRASALVGFFVLRAQRETRALGKRSAFQKPSQQSRDSGFQLSKWCGKQNVPLRSSLCKPIGRFLPPQGLLVLSCILRDPACFLPALLWPRVRAEADVSRQCA